MNNLKIGNYANINTDHVDIHGNISCIMFSLSVTHIAYLIYARENYSYEEYRTYWIISIMFIILLSMDIYTLHYLYSEYDLLAIIFIIYGQYINILQYKSKMIKLMNINFFKNPKFYNPDKKKLLYNGNLYENLCFKSDLFRYKKKQFDLLYEIQKNYDLIGSYLYNDVLNIIKKYNDDALLPKYIEYITPEELINKVITLRIRYNVITMVIINVSHARYNSNCSAIIIKGNFINIKDEDDINHTSCNLTSTFNVEYLIINNSIKKLGYVDDILMIEYYSIIQKTKTYKGIPIMMNLR